MPTPSTPRSRQTSLRDLQSSTASAIVNDTSTPKVINAAPLLEKAELYGIDNDRPTSSKIMGFLGHMFLETIPQIMAVSVMLSLIFGGCCSNVFALEAIIKPNPDSGTLLTFVQFVFVAVTGYVSQFDVSQPPFFLTPRKVPITRWLINIALFFSINVLNNHAFSYNISVPVHIILRSGGSITTIAAGYLWGKRFSRIQVMSVLLLTVGVIVSAWSDSKTKAKPAATDTTTPSFSTGLIVLFIAQVLAAIMGQYTEETYRTYGSHWQENLFYSHLLSLPLFAPFFPSILAQFSRLQQSAPLTLSLPSTLLSALPTLKASLFASTSFKIPSQLAYLIANIITQYACIRGVNLLAAKSSALTVTIVLNIRKLVSLLLSIWIFGHSLSLGVLVGAVIVFGAGAMYSLDGKGAKRKVKTG